MSASHRLERVVCPVLVRGKPFPVPALRGPYAVRTLAPFIAKPPPSNVSEAWVRVYAALDKVSMSTRVKRLVPSTWSARCSTVHTIVTRGSCSQSGYSTCTWEHGDTALLLPPHNRHGLPRTLRRYEHWFVPSCCWPILKKCPPYPITFKSGRISFHSRQ